MGKQLWCCSRDTWRDEGALGAVVGPNLHQHTPGKGWAMLVELGWI